MGSRLERRLARAEGACGCPEGAASALGVTSIYLILVLLPSVHLGTGPVAIRALGAAGVFLVSAGLGKVAGLAIARWQARRLKGQLEQLKAS
jgi:hypothetical protein